MLLSFRGLLKNHFGFENLQGRNLDQFSDQNFAEKPHPKGGANPNILYVGVPSFEEERPP